MMSPSDQLATPVLNAFQNVALAIIIERQKQTKLLRSMSNKVPSSEVTKWILRSSHDSFVHFCRQKLKQNIWKMVWFSMSLYKFKSSRCSPCNQSTQRRRKVYCCWVSSSPIKRAVYETCKYDVNHHGWSHHQGEKQIHFFQCRKYPMDSSHHRCQIFTPPFEMNSIPCIAVTHSDFSIYRPSSTGKYIRMPSFG